MHGERKNISIILKLHLEVQNCSIQEDNIREGGRVAGVEDKIRKLCNIFYYFVQ